MQITLIVLIVLVVWLGCLVDGFHFGRSTPIVHRNKKFTEIRMEYIPDGLSKAQWEELKKKEQEETAKRNYGAVGVTKFKSRAFEAWQKSGTGHLFPVSSSTPMEARPYMQRVGGSADGEDLKKKGIVPKGQATPSAKNEADLKYEQLEKEGKLFGFPLPWTAEATSKLSKVNNTSEKKSSKSSMTNKGKQSPSPPTIATEEDQPTKKKKGFFGLF